MIDAARIQLISSFNGFGTGNITMSNLSLVNELPNEVSHLYILPSYFNHACYGMLFQIIQSRSLTYSLTLLY